MSTIGGDASAINNEGNTHQCMYFIKIRACMHVHQNIHVIMPEHLASTSYSM